MGIGEIVRAYRERHGLSLRAFADKCSLSHSYIDTLEKGRDPRSGKLRSPTLTVTRSLAAGMDMSLDELIALTDARPTDDAAVDIPIYLRRPHHGESVDKVEKLTPTEALHRTDNYDDDLPEEARKQLADYKNYLRQKYGKK